MIRSLERGAPERFRISDPVLSAFCSSGLEIDAGAELLAVVEGVLKLAWTLAEEESSPETARSLLQASAPLVRKLGETARRDAGASRARVDAAHRTFQAQQRTVSEDNRATGLADPASGGALGRKD